VVAIPAEEDPQFLRITKNTFIFYSTFNRIFCIYYTIYTFVLTFFILGRELLKNPYQKIFPTHWTPKLHKCQIYLQMEEVEGESSSSKTFEERPRLELVTFRFKDNNRPLRIAVKVPQHVKL
jgi:hypothetical protein